MKKSPSLSILSIFFGILAFIFIGVLHINFLLPELSLVFEKIPKNFSLFNSLWPLTKLIVYWFLIHLFNFLGGWLFSVGWPDINALIKEKLFKRICKLKLVYFQENRDFSFYIDEYSESIYNFLIVFCSQVLPSLTIIIITLIKCYRKSLYLGLFLLGWLTILFLIIFIFSKQTIKIKEEIAHLKKVQKDTLQDVFENISLYKTFYYNFLIPEKEKEKILTKKNLFYFSIGQIFFGIFSVGGFVILVLVSYYLNMSFLKQLGWRFCWESFRIVNSFSLVLETFSKFRKARELFAFKVEDLSLKEVSIEKINSITFNNIELLERKINQISGKVGRGKTTILKSIIGLKSSENIKINHLDKINRKSLIKHFSFMDQDSLILNNTIKNNITLFEDKIDEAKLLEAFEKSGLKDLKKNLSDQCGKRGSLLSGGEKMSLKMARLLYHDNNNKILVLDEPFNNLDSNLKNLFSNIIYEFKKQGRTIIIVDHLKIIKIEQNIDREILI